MRNKARKANATAAAQAYAPRPNGSVLTYGLVGAACLLSAALIAGAFYGVDILLTPLPVLALVVLAFAAGAVLRVWRQRRHALAVHTEYGKRSRPSPPGLDIDSLKSGGAPPSGPPSQAFVTFTRPFMLPGMDEPHPPGTFQVSERREPLDVSWDAYLLIKTILLTGSGVVEALEVKADDLALALELDGKDGLAGTGVGLTDLV